MRSIVQIKPAVDVGDAVTKFGYNPDVDALTAPEDIIATGGNLYLPASVVSAANIDIVSTSTNDTAAGTGARTLRIDGLDANYKMQSEAVTLNGTTAVNPVNDYLRIFRAKVQTTGSTEVTQGNITIADGTGTFLTVLAGFNTSLTTAYTIPADYTYGYLVQYSFSLLNKTANYVTGVFETRHNGGAWQELDIFSSSEGSEFNRVLSIPIRFDAETDIRVRAVDASADNLRVRSSYQLFLR